MLKEFFGKDNDGNDIFKYTLVDEKDNSFSVINTGATIQSIKIYNKNNKLVDVVLGYDSLDEYINSYNHIYAGAVCGRVANRIEKGQFTYNGTSYQLPTNNGGNCLHGGDKGFDLMYFDLTDFGDDYLVFSAISPDGDQGFEGNVNIKVRYTFKNGLVLIEYKANTDKTTPISLTNHSYFNLDGEGTILNHSLQLNSDYFLHLADTCLVTGVILPTDDTCFDVKNDTPLAGIVKHLKEVQPPIKGFDHHMFLNKGDYDYRKVGCLKNQDSSLMMDIYTDQTGMQVYTGNYIPESIAKGVKIGENSGIALETQLPPGSLKYSHLQSMLVKPEQTYTHKTGYKFYY